MPARRASKIRMASLPTKEQFEENRVDFLLVELETGMTFAGLAQNTSKAETRTRNIGNARKAYDTLQHFLSEHDVDNPAIRDEIVLGMADLRLKLVELGDKFEG